MQVGQDVKTSAYCKSQLQFQQTNNYQLLYLTSSTYFNQQRLWADGILIPNLHKALAVSCYLMTQSYNDILDKIKPYNDKIFLLPLNEAEILELEKKIGKSFPPYFTDFLSTFGIRQDLVAELCKREQDFVSQNQFLPLSIKKHYIAIGGSTAGGDTWVVNTDLLEDQQIYEHWHEDPQMITPLNVTFPQLIQQNIETLIHEYDKLPFNHEKHWCVEFSIETRDEKAILQTIGATRTKSWGHAKTYDSGVKSYESEFILNSKKFKFNRSEYSLWKKPSYYFNLRESIDKISDGSLIKAIDKKLRIRFKKYILIDYGILPLSDNQDSS